VTTAFFAQGWSWEGGHRSPAAACALLEAIDAYRPRALTDLRVQIRAETHLVEAVPQLLEAVRRHKVPYVVFNDHLEEGCMMARTAPTDFASWARKVGRTAQDLSDTLDRAKARAREVPRQLCTLAEAFDTLGVAYGSHDDPDGETREFYSMIGARIA
jgi:alpha-D-ribose 1-methylphosphonate 5-triphosphate diphosphatase